MVSYNNFTYTTYTMIPMNQKEITLALRRNVKVYRHFDIEEIKNGNEKQTCQVCNNSIIYSYTTHGIPYSNIVRRIIVFRKRNGINQICPTCSKNEADKRYPLNE